MRAGRTEWTTKTGARPSSNLTCCKRPGLHLMVLKFIVFEISLDRCRNSQFQSYQEIGVQPGLREQRVQGLRNDQEAAVINKSELKVEPDTSGAHDKNRAVAHFQMGRSSAHLEVQMTTAGLIAVGVLVSAILLSVVPIVDVATRHLRRR